MKRNITLAYFLCGIGICFGQTNTENYIQNTVYLEPTTTSNLSVKQFRTVQYFDDLGKLKQIVNVKMSPKGRDIVTPVIYDEFGRQTRTYLPVPQLSTANGNIYPQNNNLVMFPINDVSNIYAGEKTFTENTLEKSPLDKLFEKKQIGEAWSTHPIKFDYDLNANDIKRYIATFDYSTFTSDITLSSTGYVAGQLYKSTVTDEDNNQTVEFKNALGQIILVRNMLSATEKADTYYVYNDYNQLAFVIPPNASVVTDPKTVLSELCYQYKYDNQGRLVEKKLPGKGWEYMLYDKQDRLVATQDTVMKEKGQWLYTKYDQFGRVAITGIGTGYQRSVEQGTVDSFGSNNVTRINTPFFNRQGIDVYYNNPDGSYPNSSNWVTLLSLNYYDSYPGYYFNPSFPTNILGESTLTETPTAEGLSTKSLPVMSLVKNIEDDNWTKNYTYYDKKGRAIGSYSINHLGGRTQIESRLDFAGAVQQSITHHKRLDTDTDKVIIENFTYDSQNRLLTHAHQVDNNPMEYLAQNTYNELSQLQSKKVGGNALGSGLQTVDYTYNIRGWMTQINDPNNLGTDLFGYKINYNQVDGLENPNVDFMDLKVKPRYNGNIAEAEWRTTTEDNEPVKRYGYSYDALNRLTAGFYQKEGYETAKEYFEIMQYDLNGNIARLQRSAGVTAGSTTALKIDNLRYDYTGNRLTKVTEEQIGNSDGYPYLSSHNVIEYDNNTANGNGNMTRHWDKNISSIIYNYLNLPTSITTGSGKKQNQTGYLYRADGTKLAKFTASPFFIGSRQVDYLDGFQYDTLINLCLGCPMQAANLKFVPTSEGYFDFEKNLYIYNYKDHLGNVRLSYADSNHDEVIQPRDMNVKHCEDMGDGNMACYDVWLPGEVVEVNNYYPFGMLHNFAGTTMNSYQYKYNGKELQETGMYDYGARFYMPDIGRWGVVDPLAEKMPNWSPYNYTFGNPIKYTDPTGMEPFNEYDKNGKMISNLGGNKIDFYHQRNGDTKVVIRETGASNIIKGGESIIKGYTHRGKDVGWGTITGEYFGGSGPTRSLFSDFNDSNDGPFASLDKASSAYSSLARQDALNSKNSRGLVKMNYRQANPITANFDMYEQMWGRSVISWYKLGDETLFLMTDSKSQESLFYRLPVNNFERTEGKVNSFGNTYQTYMWTESNSEVQKKVINPTVKNVIRQAITPPSILTRP